MQQKHWRTANVLHRQGQLDDLKKPLNLLDGMKPTINDSDNTPQVQAVFKAKMPENPQNTRQILK